MDTVTTLGELRTAVAGFVATRNWQPFHTPKNLAMSIAIEAAELMEHFQWLTAEQAQHLAADAAQRTIVADELADVLIYCLSFANSANIDISQAIRAKLARNETRFLATPAGSPPGDLA
jgi:NTP pyrophosphatase (non-canonical NTP hydrolase)